MCRNIHKTEREKMNFTNVIKTVKGLSKKSYNFKTIVHGRDQTRDADTVAKQFVSETQRFDYLGVKQGNLDAAAGYIGYLMSLHGVLAKTPAAQSSAAFERLWTNCEKVLLTKEKEYAGGANRFANFDRAAELHNQFEDNVQTAEQAGWSFAMKHIVSTEDQILKYVPTLRSPRKAEDTKKILSVLDEKIGDLINYVLLVSGCHLRSE